MVFALRSFLDRLLCCVSDDEVLVALLPVFDFNPFESLPGSNEPHKLMVSTGINSRGAGLVLKPSDAAALEVILVFSLYEWMDKWEYLLVCGGLAAPLLLQPVLMPSLTKEASVPLLQRFCTKANVWIALFSFLGAPSSKWCVCVCCADASLEWSSAKQLVRVAGLCFEGSVRL